MVKGKGIKNGAMPYAFLSPALVSIAVLTLMPILYTIYISFSNYNLYHMTSISFVGVRNFQELLTGSLKQIFVPVFLWNIVYTVICTLGSYILGLMLALLLNNPLMTETRIYRAFLIVPWALPPTIATLTWQGLLNQNYGGINNLLKALHLPHAIPWLTDPTFARVGILIAGLWMGFPYMMNVCLGALQALSPEYYESAELDGASKWTIFRSITLPLISRSSIPLIISSFAFNFNNFGNIYMITSGGPPRANTQYAGYTDILASAGFKMTTQFYRYDLAAAMSIILFAVVGTITFISMKASHTFKEVD